MIVWQRKLTDEESLLDSENLLARLTDFFKQLLVVGKSTSWSYVSLRCCWQILIRGRENIHEGLELDHTCRPLSLNSSFLLKFWSSITVHCVFSVSGYTPQFVFSASYILPTCHIFSLGQVWNKGFSYCTAYFILGGIWSQSYTATGLMLPIFHCMIDFVYCIISS